MSFDQERKRMKTVLFCNLPYAFAIYKPLADALREEGHEVL